MADLEHELGLLAGEIAWPPTPPLAPRVRRRRWPLAVALAAVLAVAVAFAVPQSRGAILRFLHLGAVSVRQVDTLPRARPESLRASLGAPVAPAAAAALLGRPFVPSAAPLYRSGDSVSALLDGNILLTELRTADVGILKKFFAGATQVRSISLGNRQVPALWIEGGAHVVVMPPALPARYAGNTLVWTDAGLTFRLEGRGLSLERARTIALATLR
jgi:hypothetical protein